MKRTVFLKLSTDMLRDTPYAATADNADVETVIL